MIKTHAEYEHRKEAKSSECVQQNKLTNEELTSPPWPSQETIELRRTKELLAKFLCGFRVQYIQCNCGRFKNETHNNKISGKAIHYLLNETISKTLIFKPG